MLDIVFRGGFRVSEKGVQLYKGSKGGFYCLF